MKISLTYKRKIYDRTQPEAEDDDCQSPPN
jgi:hypothetical protein